MMRYVFISRGTEYFVQGESRTMLDNTYYPESSIVEIYGKHVFIKVFIDQALEKEKIISLLKIKVKMVTLDQL